jgi:hypothetical protein
VTPVANLLRAARNSVSETGMRGFEKGEVGT